MICNFSVGLAVPIPTFPPETAKYADPLAVIAVVEAYGRIEAVDEVAVMYPTVGLEVLVNLVPSKNVSILVPNEVALVPPLPIPRVPVMSVDRSMRAVETDPAVAFKIPERLPMEKLEVNRLVDEAVVAKDEVVVALVVVELTASKVVAVKLVMVATVAVRVSMMPVVNLATVENRLVEVAEVMVALSPIPFVKLKLVMVAVAFVAVAESRSVTLAPFNF